jgi:hypothetical protein
MGKKKDKKAKKAKLPKEIAGVKVPRKLREHGQQLADLARNPLVAEVAAAGLVAVATALRESSKVKAAAAKARDAAAEAEKQSAEVAQDVKSGLTDLANLALAAATQGMQAFAEKAREKAAAPDPKKTAH